MNSRKSGFSIVELLVVICVITILSVFTAKAGSVTEPTTFRDRVMFRGSTGPDFDADNVFSIGNVKVEATAAQINAAVQGVVTGNVPVAGITNALSGTAFTTNTITGDGKTNVIIWATVGPIKVLKSITTTP